MNAKLDFAITVYNNLRKRSRFASYEILETDGKFITKQYRGTHSPPLLVNQTGVYINGEQYDLLRR